MSGIGQIQPTLLAGIFDCFAHSGHMLSGLDQLPTAARGRKQ
jgi:hypothetical protein